MRHFSQLIKVCIHPRSDYAAVAWHSFGHNTQTTTKLDRVLRLAQRTTLGAFRTTPSEALTYDSDMEPARTRLDRCVTMSAIRLLTLPDTNPVAPLTRRALRRDVKAHRTAMHSIFHSRTSFNLPSDLETIRPAPKPPWWIPNLTSHIAASKEEATEQFSNLPRDPATQHLYSDGSKTEHGKGAGAIDPHRSRQLSLRLGDASRATLFEAELAGIQLTLQLAAALPTTVTQVTIHLDNQRAILACMDRPTTLPAQHHILIIHSTLHTLRSSHPQTRFHLNWIPSHTGITGNEAADKIAKAAANNTAIDATTPPPFPTSAAIARKHARAHFTRPPEHQRHANHHRKMRGSTSSRHTVRLLSGMKRGQCSIMVQLQSGNVGLRSYLARFAHVDTPICECCATPETVEHYLTACKRHTLARSELICSIRLHTNDEIKNKSKDVATLLSDPDAVPITLRYIAATGRSPYMPPIPLHRPFRLPFHLAKTS